MPPPEARDAGAAERERPEATGASVARPGVALGVDVGAVRVGVARTDPDRLVATPLTTLPGDDAGGSPAIQLRDLVAEYEATVVVVGLPRGLSGTDGRAAAIARAFAERLRRELPEIPVVLCDERFSTVTASRNLAERGIGTRGARAVVDQAAATVILQHWLASGAPLAPGVSGDPVAAGAPAAGPVQAPRPRKPRSRKPRSGRPDGGGGR